MEFAAAHDVMILGAGPAGTSAAIRLAQLGLDVGIVERRSFPRSHVGICISDETLALISFLGLEHQFDEAQFWRRNLTAVRWGDSEASLVPQPGYHVDRGALDRLLLDRSRSEGVRIYQPVEVQSLERLPEAGWQLTIASGEHRLVLKARFIVDAAGRRAAIRGARVKDSPPLVSLHANWALRETAEFDGLIEAGKDAWLWYARTARNRAVVSIFCDPRLLKMRKADGLQAKYASLIGQFSGLQLRQLERQCSDAQACDASSHHAEDPLGEDYIQLGDACFSVDPLSSQGVHLALQSGLQGAVIVNTLLKKPENTEAAQRFFRTRLAERVGRYVARTRLEYARVAANCPSAFWRERAGGAVTVEVKETDRPFEPELAAPSGQVTASPEVAFASEPVIDGAFVEARQVLRHPSIDGSIAYLEGVDLVRLLCALPAMVDYRDIPGIWRSHVPPAIGGRIASWLWERRILVRAS